MQVVAPTLEQSPHAYHDKMNDQIRHFPLPEALAEGVMLTLNTELGVLSLLILEDQLPRIVIEQQFTSTEMAVLLPLLESYPYYCSYETLFAHFYHNNPGEDMIDHYRLHLHKAMELSTWEQEMRPIRNVLSRTRLKLRDFGLNISSIMEMGYVLMFGAGVARTQ